MEPQAELWMGAHPKAPSSVSIDGEWRSLAEAIDAAPKDALGDRVAKRFGGRLPFLFKVLAAAQPLSIQAHPNIEQAREGFARENDASVPLEAPNRNYKDDNHKPEIICALTPFWALNGFRRTDDVVTMLRAIGPSEIVGESDALAEAPGPGGLKRFFSALMTMESDRQEKTVEQVVAYAKAQTRGNAVYDWIIELNRRYPGDVGVLSPVFLNLRRLEPGEAMLLHAGQLHAYVDGVGIELMANSDNVLRGGLTPKHVDVPELLKVLTFAETDLEILRPDDDGAYPSDVDEFRLSIVEVADRNAYEGPADHSIEIIICTSGTANVESVRDGEKLSIEQGSSFVIPASVGNYRIEGTATLYKASAPLR
jgi:mannose-6-phosphate isomerase